MLEKSLHQQILITLGLQNCQDAVVYPWNLQDFPVGTSILSVFDQIGVGRTLLILGEPGSGKTISLLHLARDLIVRAEQNVSSLVPVVFNLSSWTLKQQSIADWLIEELNSNLYNVPKNIARSLVEGRQLLLLLDGLDEVQTEYRNDCAKALNLFQKEYGTEMVVCCRIGDYKCLSSRLNVQRAVYVQFLTLKQVQSYLDSLSFNLESLKTLLARDTSLQEFAQCPLRLNMMVLAYEGVAPEYLPRTGTLEERQRRLFDDYIARMFERSRIFAYAERLDTLQNFHMYLRKRKQSTRWLISLAQQMVGRYQTIFFIEQMQPTWLRSQRDRKNYEIYISLIGGMIVALVVGLFFGLLDGLFSSLFSGLFSGIVVGLVIGSIVGFLFKVSNCLSAGETIETVETLRWCWTDAKKIILLQLVFIIVFGIISGLFFWLTGGLTGLVAGTIVGMTIGSFVGLVDMLGGTVEGLNSFEIQTKVYPNQGMRKSALNSLTVGLIVGLVAGLFVGLIAGLFGDELTRGLTGGLFWGLITALLFGLTAGLNYGGKACIQHLALRLVLCQKGSTPWNYARFLDWASERIFLQKVGGGYIFIHRLLMEHFARMSVDGE